MPFLDLTLDRLRAAEVILVFSSIQFCKMTVMSLYGLLLHVKAHSLGQAMGENRYMWYLPCPSLTHFHNDIAEHSASALVTITSVGTGKVWLLACGLFVPWYLLSCIGSELKYSWDWWCVLIAVVAFQASSLEILRSRICQKDMQRRLDSNDSRMMRQARFLSIAEH